jgi:glucokinase
MTNAMVVDATSVAERLKFRRTHVVNDLEALAYGVTVLEADELTMIQRGVPHPEGNAAVIAAGTGLGEAMLPTSTAASCQALGRGHATLPPARPGRSLLRDLTRIYGRVS